MCCTCGGGSASNAFAEGTGEAARFASPHDVAVSLDGERLFVADTFNDRIRQILIATGEVTTLAGGAVTFRPFLTASPKSAPPLIRTALPTARA